MNKGEILECDDGTFFAPGPTHEYTWLPGTKIFTHDVPTHCGEGIPQAGIYEVREFHPEGVLYQLYTPEPQTHPYLDLGVGLSSDGLMSTAGDVCGRVEDWDGRFRVCGQTSISTALAAFLKETCCAQ